MNSLSNMPKDIINKMFLFMSHPLADIFRDACVCSSCKGFNKDPIRKICHYCNKYIYVRVVKIMNNSQENQMINGFPVARIALRIELVRLQWMKKAGKLE